MVNGTIHGIHTDPSWLRRKMLIPATGPFRRSRDRGRRREVSKAPGALQRIPPGFGKWMGNDQQTAGIWPGTMYKVVIYGRILWWENEWGFKKGLNEISIRFIHTVVPNSSSEKRVQLRWTLKYDSFTFGLMKGGDIYIVFIGIINQRSYIWGHHLLGPCRRETSIPTFPTELGIIRSSCCTYDQGGAPVR